MRARIVFSVLLALSACGDDDDPGGGIDAGAGRFEDPSQLDREGCDDSLPLTSVDLAGIWHLDAVFEFASVAFPLRFDGAPGAYSAVFRGQDMDEVRVTPSDVFVRSEWLDGDAVRVRALTLCRVDPDGSLFGHYAGCAQDDCISGTVQAYPIRPLDEPISAGVSRVGSLAWDDDAISANVRVRDGVAYVVRFEDGLRIVDVSDPASPVGIGHSPVALDGEIYNDVKLVDAGLQRYALVASNLRGVISVDVTAPSAPQEVINFPLPEGGGDSVAVHTLFIDGDRAYLANLSIGGIDIYGVANPASPQPLGRYILPDVVENGAGFVHDLYVEGGRAYLNYWDHGMVVIDTLDDPASPTLVGVFDGYERRTSHSVWVTDAGGRRVAVHGDEDFGAHVRIVDVEPGSADFMTEIGSYQTRPEVSVHNILAVGETAFVTYYQDGLRVLDLSDPTNPVEVGHYRTWSGVAESNGRSFYEGAIGVAYDNATDLIHVVDTHEGLLILSLDP